MIINVPNSITVFRTLLLIPFTYLLYLNNSFFWILFIVFYLLDILDGFIARKLNQETKFGANFDQIADILMGASVIITQLILGKIPMLLFMIFLVLMGLLCIQLYPHMKKHKKFKKFKRKELSAASFVFFQVTLLSEAILFAYGAQVLFLLRNIDVYFQLRNK